MRAPHDARDYHPSEIHSLETKKKKQREKDMLIIWCLQMSCKLHKSNLCFIVWLINVFQRGVDAELWTCLPSNCLCVYSLTELLETLSWFQTGDFHRWFASLKCNECDLSTKRGPVTNNILNLTSISFKCRYDLCFYISTYREICVYEVYSGKCLLN